MLNILREIDYISYKIDKLGRFVLNEDVLVKPPWIESDPCWRYAGEIIDAYQFIRLEQMCKEGMCYSTRPYPDSNNGKFMLQERMSVPEGRGDKTFQNPSLYEV